MTLVRASHRLTSRSRVPPTTCVFQGGPPPFLPWLLLWNGCQDRHHHSLLPGMCFSWQRFFLKRGSQCKTHHGSCGVPWGWPGAVLSSVTGAEQGVQSCPRR